MATTLTSLCGSSVLGLRQLLPLVHQEFSAIVSLLTLVLTKYEFKWDTTAVAVFWDLQHALMPALILRLLDFQFDFIIECDASGTGLDTVLHQGSGPVALFNHPLAPRHTKLVAYENKLIILVQVVHHWRLYLWGRAFVILTDHFSLEFLLD
jgi:hypothetical protein